MVIHVRPVVPQPRPEGLTHALIPSLSIVEGNILRLDGVTGPSVNAIEEVHYLGRLSKIRGRVVETAVLGTATILSTFFGVHGEKTYGFVQYYNFVALLLYSGV